MIVSIFNKSISLIILLILLILSLLIPSVLFADLPDYYTGQGKEYVVKYYSYLDYDDNKEKYYYLDEITSVDLNFGTFYKVIYEKNSNNPIIGAFYKVGKLQWALTYDFNGNVVRIEKYNRIGELISDKYFTADGKLYYESIKDKCNIYTPMYKRKSQEDIRYVFAYMTKGEAIEIIDRRDVTKWYQNTVKQDCIIDRYYSTVSGKLVKESVYESNYNHIYDRQFYYDYNDRLEYVEYYENNKLVETTLYMYKGENLIEKEYRGKDDSNIVREIYKNGSLEKIIAYHIYYIPEVIINFNESGNVVEAIHNRYDSTFRLIKTHHYKLENNRFISETVTDVLGNVYEEVTYSYNNDRLSETRREGKKKGDEYIIEISYSYDSKGNPKSANVSGTISGNISYSYNKANEVIEMISKISDTNMNFYSNSNGILNIDLFQNESGKVYDKSERVIASKKYIDRAVVTVTNK
ncbi:MAG: hypothetical protein ACOCV8_02660, partial [Spirochaetota bacterium]